MDPNTGVDLPLTPDQGIISGSIVKTTTDSIVEFRYPSGNSVVDLGSDSQFQFVGIQQETNADGTLKLEATVPPLPNEGYTGPYEEGLVDEGLGPLGLFLGGIFHGAKGVVVEGIIYLLEGTGHFLGEHFANTDTYYAEPIAISQGYLIPMGTEYIVSVSNQGTTINVITGPLVFLDWKSGNTVQLESGQSLTLPNAGQSGFSSQDLQNKVSPWNSTSVNQWWVVSNGLGQFLWLIIVVPAVIAVIAVLAAVLVWRSRRKARVQQMPIPPPPPPPPF
jgi:hypothetical protein